LPPPPPTPALPPPPSNPKEAILCQNAALSAWAQPTLHKWM
jgi:hypothetical protein